MQSSNRPYLPEIDHLRAYAALLILLYHGVQLIGAYLATGLPFSADAPWPQPANPFLIVITEGHSAVSLFLVLSGFILSHGMLHRQPRYRRFLLARILRIYPMLLLCLLAAASASEGDLLTLLSTLIPIDPHANLGSPFTSMFWAVKIELQCYLLFPVLLWALREKGAGALLWVVALCMVMRLLAVLGAGANPRDLSYWTLAGRIDQFAIGMLAAKLYSERASLFNRPWMFPLALLSAFAMLFTFNRFGGWPTQHIWRVAFPPIEALVWAGVILTYLSFGRLLPAQLGRAVAALGVISYSAYLLHPVFINIVVSYQWWLAPTGRGDWDALITTILIVLPALILTATLTFKLVEAPAMSIRPKYASGATQHSAQHEQPSATGENTAPR
ncbi:acyltransferase family protein [Devosia naphthalenivorans]|uniref:acyltransferase family protein n=1 Tax=Devosia naphthalenivorans TaxID=2082392 RepID=UPI000D3CBA14|nr:acyltransferase [Devosia naphthalenivorans]